MRRVALSGTVVVVLATAVNLLHGVAHGGQQVMSLPTRQWAYVLLVIFVAPVVAAALPWTRHGLAGAWLRFTSMTGSLVLGLAYRFWTPRADDVSTLRPGAWLTPFRVSAMLLLLLQGTRSAVGMWALHVLSPSSSNGARATAGILGTQSHFREELR